jgi:hypothetical protein
LTWRPNVPVVSAWVRFFLARISQTQMFLISSKRSE